jgi:hypothetical protein
MPVAQVALGAAAERCPRNPEVLLDENVDGDAIARRVVIFPSVPGFPENIVQAISRDLLATAMVAVNRAGYTIVQHCHDEIVVEEAVDSTRTHEDLAALMAVPPPWRRDLLLAAEGQTSVFYKK